MKMMWVGSPFGNNGRRVNPDNDPVYEKDFDARRRVE